MARGGDRPGRSRIAIGRWLLSGVALTVGGGAQAADFHVTPSIEVGETYNDNVNLDPRGSEHSDLITSISPGLSLLSQGSRVKLGLNYAPQELLYAKGTSENQFRQRLEGTGHAEIWPESVFFDARASIDQQFVNSAGPVSTSTLTGNNNLQTVQAYSASPSLKHHFGRYADSESRYTFSSVSTGGGTVAPSQVHDLAQTVTSGDYFGRLGWTAVLEAVRNERGDSGTDTFAGTTTKEELARVDLRYRVFRGISALGSVGYDRIRDPSLTSQINEVTWNAGFDYAPNPRAEATLTYGRAFGQTAINFTGRYNFGASLNVQASYAETIQTSQGQIAQGLSSLGISQTGQLINTRTGLPFSPGGGLSGIPGSPLGISSSAFVDKLFQLTASSTRGRNVYTATAFYERQDFETPVSNNTALGGTAGWTRQLQPRLQSNLTGSLGHNTFSDPTTASRHDLFYTIAMGLTYNLSPTMSANLTASRTSRYSTLPQDRIDNDLVGISVRKQF